MRIRGHRWRLAAAVAALAIVVSVVAIGLSGGQGSSSGGAAPVTPVDRPASTGTGGSAVTAAPTSTTLAPARLAADVAAAQACQAFTVYLDDAQKGRIPAAAGRTLVSDAAALLAGSQQDQATGRALPPWATLGSDLLAAAEDVVDRRPSMLRSDGGAAAALCRTVPPASAQAGGFQRRG